MMVVFHRRNLIIDKHQPRVGIKEQYRVRLRVLLTEQNNAAAWQYVHNIHHHHLHTHTN